MKHPTDHLKKLRNSVRQARTILQRVPKHESQTTLDHLKVQSFVLLVHSALEEYLETLGYECAIAARKTVKENSQITPSLLGLVTAKLIRDLPEKSKKKLASDVVANLDTFSIEAMSEYHQVVSDNNGIKADDQKKLMLPIGVDPETVDLETMNNLDAFGLTRGKIAHNFTAIRIDLTRNDIENKVDLILKGITQFDKAACNALRTLKLDHTFSEQTAIVAPDAA